MSTHIKSEKKKICTKNKNMRQKKKRGYALREDIIIKKERVVLKKNKYEIDMCNGTIMDKLISFSIPLMLSGILQLMLNAVDIVVVGRFSGSQALAAVGSTTALINVFTNLFIGISLGANVLTEILCGRKNKRNAGDGTYGYCTCSGKRSGDGGDRSGLCQRRAGNYGDTG